jgi:hypothetical protein
MFVSFHVVTLPSKFKIRKLIFLIRVFNLIKYEGEFKCMYQRGTFRNKLDFYGEDLLALHPIHKPEYHPLSPVCNCLFDVFAATLQILMSSLLSATRGRAMSW